MCLTSCCVTVNKTKLPLPRSFVTRLHVLIPVSILDATNKIVQAYTGGLFNLNSFDAEIRRLPENLGHGQLDFGLAAIFRTLELMCYVPSFAPHHGLFREAYAPK